jgi:RNA polymerase sigma-70 factor (ECF subfamily)
MRPEKVESDEAWAQRAQTDREAFGELVRRYADKIYNLAYRMTGDRTEAEDLAQEAFVRAYRGLPGFKQEYPFGAWLYRIAVNVCLTERRHKGSAPADQLSEESEISIGAPSLEETAERHEMQAAVQQAILSLPPMYRAVVILYHLEGRSYDEIATLLDLPINTVRTHLHRGRALLKDRLAPSDNR